MRISLLAADGALPEVAIELPEEEKATCWNLGQALLASKEDLLKTPGLSLEILEALHLTCTPGWTTKVTEPYDLPVNLDWQALLTILEPVHARIQPVDLAGRLADLNWIVLKNAASGHRAIDLYLSAAQEFFDPDKWVDSYERIRRVLGLAAQLRNASMLEKARAFLRDRLIEMQGTDPLWMTEKLGRLYLTYRNHSDQEIVRILKTAARIAEREQNNYKKSYELWSLVADCYKETPHKRRRAQLLAVRTRINEVQSQGNPLYRSSMLQDAVSDLKDIKNSQSLRDRLLNTLHREQQATTASFQELFRTEVNIEPVVKWLESELAIADVHEALFKFASFYRPQPPEMVLQRVQEQRQANPLQRLFATTQYDSRAKVASKHTFSGDGSSLDELWPQIMQDYQWSQHFHASTVILPSLHILHRSHYIQYHHILDIVTASPFVPQALKKTCAGALHAGFQKDMAVFACMGIPLFEASLRHLFLAGGGTALRQDPKTGVQSEIMLNGLLTSREIEQLLGTAITADLRCLLEDEHGWKWRHLLAHGMLTDAEFFSGPTYYAFLALFFLVVDPLRRSTASPGP